MSRQPSKEFRFRDMPGFGFLVGWFVAGKQEQRHQKKQERLDRRRWKYRKTGEPVGSYVFIGTVEEWKLFQRSMRRKHGKDYFL